MPGLATFTCLWSCTHVWCPHATSLILTCAARCIVPYILVSFLAYILLLTSQCLYCSCHLANMWWLLYHIVSHHIAFHHICSFQCLTGGRGLDWVLMVDVWCCLSLTPHSFSCHFISFFYLYIWMWSCHATSGPFWMWSASPANVWLLTVFISGLSRHVLDIVLSP